MSETAVGVAIRTALGSRADVRLFRNTVGAYRNDAGQFIRYGLGVGTSDLIGWRSIVITPDMVGKRVAVFAAIETKSHGTVTKKDRLQSQRDFVKLVRVQGGLAGFAFSVDQAVDILNQRQNLVASV